VVERESKSTLISENTVIRAVAAVPSVLS